MMKSAMGAALFGLVLASACSGGENKQKAAEGPVTIDDRALFQQGAGSDGRLTLEEFKTVSRGIHTQLDSNSDGLLTTEEIARLPENRRPSWLVCDIDRNGTVTAAEYEGVVPGKFTMRDKNYDGAVTTDEIPAPAPPGSFAEAFLF